MQTDIHSLGEHYLGDFLLPSGQDRLFVSSSLSVLYVKDCFGPLIDNT